MSCGDRIRTRQKWQSEASQGRMQMDELNTEKVRQEQGVDVAAQVEKQW
jgi:hypothetical protein